MAKLGDKYAIGTEHVIDGITVVVEEAEYPELCKGCVFSFNVGAIPCCNLPEVLKNLYIMHDAVCYASERTDGKNIIFRKVVKK